MYDPVWKNITTSLNEFMKKRFVPVGIKGLFHKGLFHKGLFHKGLFQKKHYRVLIPIPLVFNMPYNSVELVRSSLPLENQIDDLEERFR
jgi:hypothetical protein